MVIKSMRVILLFFIGLLVVFPLITGVQESHNCDFAAVLARNNHLIAEITDGLEHPIPYFTPLVYDCPEDYFYDFVSRRSSNISNDDGFGLCYARDGAKTIPWQQIPPNPQTWHTPFTYYLDPPELNPIIHEIMDDAADRIMEPRNRAVMVMSHARNASPTSGPGNHPFFLDWNGRTYAFMHNGSITDDVKYAMWYQLYYLYGSHEGQWFEQYPSNWNNNPLDWENFIDSEILFHWIMRKTIAVHGSIFSGMRSALTAVITSDQGTVDLGVEFTIHPETAPPGYGTNRINFVLSDCESLFIYRNTPTTWQDYYLLSYHYFSEDGFVGVKTGAYVGTTIQQYTLVHITRFKVPMEISNFPDATFADLQIWIKDDPDPVGVGEFLTYKLVIFNNGNEDASNVEVGDALPPEIPIASYSFDEVLWLPWTGGINLGNMPEYTAVTLYIRGQVQPHQITPSMSYTAKVSSANTFDPDYRDNKKSEKTGIRY